MLAGTVHKNTNGLSQIRSQCLCQGMRNKYTLLLRIIMCALAGSLSGLIASLFVCLFVGLFLDENSDVLLNEKQKSFYV